MDFPATFRGNSFPLSPCSSCCYVRFNPSLPSFTGFGEQRIRHYSLKLYQVSSVVTDSRAKRGFSCRVTEKQTEPDGNNDKEEDGSEGGDQQSFSDSFTEDKFQLDPQAFDGVNNVENKDQGDIQDIDNVEVASGSPRPGLKPQQLDESFRIPRETIEILKNQVFGFDTFFVQVRIHMRVESCLKEICEERLLRAMKR